jgi:hypothetical protein
MGTLKRRSRTIFLLMIACVLLGTASTQFSFISRSIGVAVILVGIAVGFFLVGRLKCTHCGFVLSRKLPTGALPLLWLAEEQCQNCNEPIV